MRPQSATSNEKEHAAPDFPTMHSNKTLIAGISILLALLAVGAYLLYANPALLQTSTAPTQNLTVINVTRMQSDLAQKKYDVSVPRSKASAAYYDAFNKSLNEAALMEDAYTSTMIPLITKVRDAYTSQNLSGLSDLATKITLANQTQKDRTTILKSYLDSLSTANKATTDAQTNQLTTAFLEAGQRLVTAFTAYTALTDKVLSGAGLDASTVTTTKTTAETLQTTMIDFNNSANALAAFFKKTITANLSAAQATQ